MSDNGYVKITFEDVKIAENFFENDKHLDEFLAQVCRYYIGFETSFKHKNVKKFFETYKKVMDRVIKGRSTGSIGGKKRIENQHVVKDTLEGVLEVVVKGSVKDTLEVKERKEKEINKNKKLSKKEQFLLDFDSDLIQVFISRPNIEQSILEWIEYKFTKGKGYSTLKWLTMILKYSDYQINQAIGVSLSREYEGLFPESIREPKNDIAPISIAPKYHTPGEKLR